MDRRTALRFAPALLLGFAAAAPAAESIAERRAKILRMRAETLAKLYRFHPPARHAIATAAGYAVFSNVGVNLFLLSAAAGSGVAHDNRSGHDTFMKMASGGVGVGLGVKDFRGVFVFTRRDAFTDFVEHGWEAGGTADVVAKDRKEGKAVEAAVTVAPGVKLYQLTERGLAVEASLRGTKYFKDDELNRGR